MKRKTKDQTLPRHHSASSQEYEETDSRLKHWNPSWKWQIVTAAVPSNKITASHKTSSQNSVCTPVSKYRNPGCPQPHTVLEMKPQSFFHPFILPTLPAWSPCSSYLMREQYPLTPHRCPYHQPPDSNNRVQDFLCSCIRTFLLLQNTLGLSHPYKPIKDCAGKQGEHRSSGYLAETSFYSTITTLAVKKE